MSEIRNNKKGLLFAYEIVIIILAIIAATLTILELNNRVVLEPGSYIYWIDLGILIIFTIDYFTRLFLAKDKKQFFKNNIFHLIAIIPFTSMFRIFRAFRLFKIIKVTKTFKVTKISRMTRLVKGLALLGKLRTKLNVFIHTNGLIYIIYISAANVILGAIGIHFFEFKHLGRTFGDSLWWSFVTTSTGIDIVPESIIGRLIAVILMLVGIGFVGMFTGTIATYFLDRKKISETENESKTIIDISDLESEKIKQILDYVEFMRNKD